MYTTRATAGNGIVRRLGLAAGRGARPLPAGDPPCPRSPCCCWLASSTSRLRYSGARGAAARPSRGRLVIFKNAGRWVQFQGDPATLEAVRAFVALPG